MKTFNDNVVTQIFGLIKTALSDKSDTDHTHNYAGSSSAGGAANSAAKLTSAKTISLSGDVSGSTNFDGSGNVDIKATLSSTFVRQSDIEPFVVTATLGDVVSADDYCQCMSCTLDKTHDEIVEAYNSGKHLICDIPDVGMELALTATEGDSFAFASLIATNNTDQAVGVGLVANPGSATLNLSTIPTASAVAEKVDKSDLENLVDPLQIDIAVPGDAQSGSSSKQWSGTSTTTLSDVLSAINAGKPILVNLSGNSNLVTSSSRFYPQSYNDNFVILSAVYQGLGSITSTFVLFSADSITIHQDPISTKDYVNDRISTHDTSTSAHSDIRKLLATKVDSTTTINGKALSGNITLTADDIGVDASSAASSAVSTHNTATDAHSDIRSEIQSTTNALTAHTSSTTNPHSVTKAQVGLGNVPNVATNDQTPTYTAATSLTNLVSGEKLSVAFGKIYKAIADLISHLANTSNPHSITKSQVGLGSVDNTSDANKPVSTAQASAIADAKKAGTDAQSNLDTHTEDTSNPHSVTKSQVGLGNVDNVKQYSASNPPPYPVTSVNSKTGAVSLTASDVGADASGTASSAVSTHNTSTSAHSDIRELITGLTTRLNALADSDDTTLDQMSEIVAYIKSNKDLIDSITTSKVNVSDIIDNLTTNVSTKPLSAAQGVAIKALIDALQTEVDAKAAASDLTSHTGNTSNPHGVTKSQVGLSNVPNVTTNNQTPTYTAASTLTALKSGEVLSTAFGKLAKAVSDLISHLANTSNPHSVTKSQVGLGNVENKSAATILGEMTKSNVTTALGYTPPEQDTVYTHPSYTAKSSGLYKVTVDSSGHVSAATAVAKSDITALGIPSTNTTYSEATTSTAGLLSATDKSKLDGIATGANAYTHPSYTAKSSGLYKVTVDSSGHVSATTAVAKSDITGLGIPAQDTTYSNMTAATSSAAGTAGLVPAPAAGKQASFLRGDGTWAVPTNTVYTHPSYTAKSSGLYKVTVDATGHVSATAAVAKSDITALGIPSSDTTYSAATTSAAGLMSASDKSKLDGIATGANAYTHPSYTARTGVPTANQTPAFGGTFSVTQPVSDATGHITAMTSRTVTIPSTAASTSAAGLMSAADKSKMNYTNMAYGTCATAAATAAKVITVSGNTNWALTAGSMITIKFDETNTAENPTFNVNGTGAKSVWYNTAVITTGSLSYAGYASRPATYVYDGTQFVFVSWSYDANTTYTNVKLGHGYATCSTAAATTAKVATLSSYTLVTGGIVAVRFTYDVPAGATLNINSKGAKAIYYRNAAITAGVIKAGDIATFIYSTYYRLISIDRDVDTTYSAATTSAAGLMSAADKTKLDGIATGANAYTHPSYTAKSAGLYKVTVDATGHVSAATAVAKSDITALGIPAQDTTYTHPSYTARTGKPTANQTPAFGGTATVSQITSDATGHVTAATDRTITIPSTLSNGTGTAGLIKTSSTVTSSSGYTACPVISGVPYFKNTTYSTGTASATGLTKLYTGTGTATDGTMTQSAITTALASVSSTTIVNTTLSASDWVASSDVDSMYELTITDTAITGSVTADKTALDSFADVATRRLIESAGISELWIENRSGTPVACVYGAQPTVDLAIQVRIIG